MEDKISELEQLRSENEQLKKKLNEARYLPFNLNVFKKALNNISDSVLIMSTDRIILLPMIVLIKLSVIKMKILLENMQALFMEKKSVEKTMMKFTKPF